MSFRSTFRQTFVLVHALFLRLLEVREDPKGTTQVTLTRMQR